MPGDGLLPGCTWMSGEGSGCVSRLDLRKSERDFKHNCSLEFEMGLVSNGPGVVEIRGDACACYMKAGRP